MKLNKIQEEKIIKSFTVRLMNNNKKDDYLWVINSIYHLYRGLRTKKQILKKTPWRDKDHNLNVTGIQLLNKFLYKDPKNKDKNYYKIAFKTTNGYSHYLLHKCTKANIKIIYNELISRAAITDAKSKERQWQEDKSWKPNRDYPYSFLRKFR